ncbi:hypothetical protein D9756_010432 [Leucocoprinus leucothites]|uniref:F-box domain-containing protein n=1 Tax=Leucocoprinus leucothites TaxID=201217 RepID=A0A8H5CRQ3_9AGAR|nr:hypothetical protein D9756_010432 [Leucoagaricus leucothites]
MAPPHIGKESGPHTTLYLFYITIMTLVKATEDCSLPSPYLPYELQQEIFELAAQAHPDCAPRLATVSSQVQFWYEPYLPRDIFLIASNRRVEPLIYSIIVLDFPFSSIQLFIRTFRSRPKSFFAKYVRHLYITSIVGISDARDIVSACTGVLTVKCWIDARPNIQGMHFVLPTHTLRRLSIKIETLFGYTIDETAYKFRSEDYPQLTHLEIVNPPGHNSSICLDWEGISELPSLKYLVLGDMWGYDHYYLFNAMEEILRRCPRLRALVVMSRDYDFSHALQIEPIVRNPRLVLLPSFHWPDTQVGYEIG